MLHGSRDNLSLPGTVLSVQGLLFKSMNMHSEMYSCPLAIVIGAIHKVHHLTEEMRIARYNTFSPLADSLDAFTAK